MGLFWKQEVLMHSREMLWEFRRLRECVSYLVGGRRSTVQVELERPIVVFSSVRPVSAQCTEKCFCLFAAYA